jgi:hypothetical protein
MTSGKKPQKPSRDSAWEESRLPGQRSGEGMKDLFDLVLRDIRRRAGLPPKPKSDQPEKPDKPDQPEKPDEKA